MGKRERKLGHLTHIENIALDLVFEAVNEERINRTAFDYLGIAVMLPPLDDLHHMVNQQLRQRICSSSYSVREICRFKAGDRVIKYEPYPRSISRETIRSALVLSGMRQVGGRRGSLDLSGMRKARRRGQRLSH